MDVSAAIFAFDPTDCHFKTECGSDPSGHGATISDIRRPDLHQDSIATGIDDENLVQDKVYQVSVKALGQYQGEVTTNTQNTSVQPESIASKENPVPLFRDLQSTARSAKKKKRHQKKAISKALNTVHGFTPITSADEDSDFSPRGARGRAHADTSRSPSVVRKDLQIKDLSPQNGSPQLRSASPSSISALTLQFEDLRSRSPSVRPEMTRTRSKLAESETTSSASLTSDAEANDDIAPTTCYEVKIEHDFISPDVPAKERGELTQEDPFNGGIVRKMQATDFEPLRCLGKGTYGTVFLVKQHGTGRLYAQKQFRKASLTIQKHLIEQTKTERSILESINRHPFVVKLFYAFQDHEKLYLILEYAQGGELFERMRTERMFPEETAAFYMAELVLALDHLHRNVGVIYRDLKPENCLLDAEGHLLLTDFGLSKVAVDGDYRTNSITGTVEYMAPEVVLGRNYDTTVDWWSLGVLGFDLLTGSSPFQANNDLKIKQKIVRSKLVLPYFMSMDAKDLLTRLLRKEPAKRLGANMPQDLQTIKAHRFFRKIDWKRLERREVEPPIKPLITDPELAENFSNDFTSLAVSPVKMSAMDTISKQNEHNPFGGFSFVGSRSLLESDLGCW